MGFEGGTVGQCDFSQVAGLGGRLECRGRVGAEHIHAVMAHVFLQGRGQFGAFGFLNGDQVFNAQGVQNLAAQAFGQQAGANAFARRVNGRGRTGRAAAHHQHVVRRLVLQGGCRAGGNTGIELAEDVADIHAATAQQLPVVKDHGHGHDLARLHFVLKQCAVNHGHAHVRVVHGHEGERLHHIGAVLARQAHEHVKRVRAGQLLNLADGLRIDLGRVAARPQQRQHQRGKFMPQRKGGKFQLLLRIRAPQAERGFACAVAIEPKRDLVAHGGHLLQQAAHVGGVCVVAQSGGDGDGAAQHAHVLLQLGGHFLVEHGIFLWVASRQIKTIQYWLRLAVLPVHCLQLAALSRFDWKRLWLIFLPDGERNSRAGANQV